jgi:plastocyanin
MHARPRSSTPALAFAAAAALVRAGCGDDGGDDDGGDCNACDAPDVDASPDGSSDAPTDGRAPDAMTDAPPGATLNDCTAMGAQDRTELADQREITFASFAYLPKCMRIKVGQSVRWTGDFVEHPLRPGAIVGGVRTAQAGNPITATSGGAEVRITFTTAGAYGYYCDLHWASGMRGAIYVVP